MYELWNVFPKLQIYELLNVFVILPVYILLYFFFIDSTVLSNSFVLYVIIYQPSLPPVGPDLQMVGRVAGGSTTADVLWSSSFWLLLKAEFWENLRSGLLQLLFMFAGDYLKQGKLLAAF